MTWANVPFRTDARGVGFLPNPGETMTPEMLIVLASLTAFRERHGAEKCRRNGVGAVRALIGRILPSNVTELPAARSPEILEFVRAQQSAQAEMARLCRSCGGCRLARE